MEMTSSLQSTSTSGKCVWKSAESKITHLILVSELQGKTENMCQQLKKNKTESRVTFKACREAQSFFLIFRTAAKAHDWCRGVKTQQEMTILQSK